MEFSIYSVFIAVLTSLLIAAFLKILIYKLKFTSLVHYDFLTLLVWLIFYRLFLPCSFMIGIPVPFSNFFHSLDTFLEQPGWLGISGFGWISWIWLAGALVALGRYYYQHRRREALAWLIIENAQKKEITDLIPHWKGPEYPVYISKHVENTFVFGSAGIIVLPDRDFSQRELEFIIMHEVRHLFNEDGLYMKLIRWLQIMYWWFPLLRHFTSVLTLFYEIRVDSMVVEHFEPHTILDYSCTLLKFARRRNENLNHSFTPREAAALGFSEPSLIEVRIKHLMQRTAKPKKLGIAAYFAMVLVYSISAFLILAESNLLF